MTARFQSTPSGRKATKFLVPPACLATFQSTPSGRKATAVGRAAQLERECFNPRLPGGRRPGSIPLAPSQAVVSIHAFREEGDGVPRAARDRRGVSIHAFREEGDRIEGRAQQHGVVSIHAFREEGDVRGDNAVLSELLFQSTPSGRKATSIVAGCSRLERRFNPRLPGGRRHAGVA